MEETILPIYEVDFPLLSKITFDLWPKENFNTIRGSIESKYFFNKAYKILLEELNRALDNFHPATWIRESYIQLELWSVILFKHESGVKIEYVEGPAILAPIGRYGWRYVLEICLERLSNTKITNSVRPGKNDIAKVFTLLLALSHCAEYSNYLHHFEKNLSSAEIILSPYIFTKGPNFKQSESDFFEGIKNYIKEKPDWEKYSSFSIDNDPKLMEMIDRMLLSYFGFTIGDVRYLSEVFFQNLSPKLGASILVTTYEDAVELFSAYCSFHPSKVKSILDFILLDIESPNYNKRDFLSRSQIERMINYAGAVIHLTSNLETIYSAEAARYDFITSSNRHIILTATLIPEWLDVFNARLVFGQRHDLKDISFELKKDISVIEHYFHKNIYESELKKLLSKSGFACTSLDKFEGKLIDCGEIDILAYNACQNKLFIVEAKFLSPATDARSMGKVLSDHFTQKKYHQKFMSKIEWVKNNMTIVRQIFLQKFNIEILDSVSFESYFITGSSNVVKFSISDYEILTFYELDKLITDEYSI